MTPVLWIVGRMLVGGAKAKFTDAIKIILLGAIASAVVGMVLSGIVGTLVELVVILVLAKKFYDCSWGKAIVIAVVTVIVFAIIAAVLVVVLGVSLGGFDALGGLGIV